MNKLLARSIAGRTEIVRGLLGELQAGSQQASRRLFELYYRPLVQFFANRGLPPEDCLDLTQETFLGIYTGIGSFRREASFDTWLFKIATNVYRKHQRWKAADKRAAEEVPLEVTESEPASDGNPGPGAPEPEGEMLRKERVRLAREAIERMPDQMRKCLILRIDQELKYREIGVAMRLSTETVKAHLNQARRRLRQELQSYFDAGLEKLGENEP